MTLGVQESTCRIERVRDRFAGHVLAADADAALTLLARDAALEHLPSGTGGRGTDALRRFLVDDLLPHLPADLTTRRVWRMVDRFRVVDKVVVAFTHDRRLPWLLPGVAATGRRAEVLMMSAVTVRRSRISSVRMLWDHAGLLAQLGIGEPQVSVLAGNRGTRPEAAGQRCR